MIKPETAEEIYLLGLGKGSREELLPDPIIAKDLPSACDFAERLVPIRAYWQDSGEAWSESFSLYSLNDDVYDSMVWKSGCNTSLSRSVDENIIRLRRGEDLILTEDAGLLKNLGLLQEESSGRYNHIPEICEIL